MSTDQGGFEHGRDDDPRYADLPRVRVRVPDDARDLDADVRAYHRELRRRADEGGPPAPRAVPTACDARRSGRMVVGVLALLLIVAGLAMMVSPRRDLPTRTPLATVAIGSTEPGAPGGLLPEVIVVVDRAEHALRELRPAVVALVPPDCACDGELATLFAESGQYGLKVLLAPVVVQPSLTRPGGADDPYVELARVAKAFGPKRAAVLQDPAGALVAAYEARGLTLLLVAADGIVTEVRRAPSALTGLNLGLARLSHPAGAAGGPGPETGTEADPGAART